MEDAKRTLTMDIRGYVESLPMFSELTGPEVELLVPLCRLVSGGIGNYILEEGASVHTIYFLISGELNVRKEGMLIGTVGKGAVLGEMTLLNHAPAFATIQAKGPYKALAIEQLAFSQLLEEHARLGYKILKKIARLLALRLMMTDAKLTDCMSHSARLSTRQHSVLPAHVVNIQKRACPLPRGRGKLQIQILPVGR